MHTLGDALPTEQARVRELIVEYRSVPMGHIAASFMEQSLKNADQAVMSGDVVAMLRALEDLRGYR
jgi:hypothetical protein